MTSEASGQKSWKDYGLPDIRHVSEELHTSAPSELKAANNIEEAAMLVANIFGLKDNHDSASVSSPIGDIKIQRENIRHIVEKRPEARERYTNHALKAIQEPFEIWKVKYDNGEYRYAFISLFSNKKQMYVVVAVREEETLWNFMHTDKKNLNKHRRGDLVFKR